MNSNLRLPLPLSTLVENSHLQDNRTSGLDRCLGRLICRPYIEEVFMG